MDSSTHAPITSISNDDVNEIHLPVQSSSFEFAKLYKQSIENPEAFWRDQALSTLKWFREFDEVCQGSYEKGDIAWFTAGQINACYNAIDRHIKLRSNQVAIIHEADEPGKSCTLTYAELLDRVCRVANAMKKMGVKKGDFVTLYMPMIPDAAVAMLACARIGAPHSVVFAGFSEDALRDRILDANCKFVVTADEGKRGGKTINLKRTVDAACSGCPCVQTVFVFKNTMADVPFSNTRDVWITELLPKMRPYCPCEPMDSEDTLFILYTSGSTGKPKGLLHSTAGYLLHATLTTKHVFDLREGDIYACVADIGWITGHSYIIYGPLVNGATTLMFESTPLYPDHGRYWDLVQKHKINQLYTAPTAIRSLMRFGIDIFEKYDLSSLRVLGTVGEPINPEAWRWYFNNVGKKKCSIVDTWWQTETGGHMLTPLPGITPMKPGSCCHPFLGVEPVILDPASGVELKGNDAEGVLAIKKPWPSIARTVYGDHERYLNVYMRPYSGYYFTGDGCKRDKDGYYWITGRVDDVLNVSGHRIGTAEVESALVAHAGVSEAAVVGFPEPVKGQGLCCYVTLVSGYPESTNLELELKQQVRRHIGAFATPDIIAVVPGLPKTRSGKIMRRILRKVAEGESDQLGDVSTLADPGVVAIIISKVEEVMEHRNHTK